MDRDKRWDRTRKAYDALANAAAEYRYPTAQEALAAAYARGENDEFVAADGRRRAAPDRRRRRVHLLQLPPDRARQLTLAFSDPAFAHFPVRTYADLVFATMTRYEENFPNPILFGPRPQYHVLGEIVADRRPDAAAPRRDREVRARDVLLQRRARGRVPGRRPHPDPVEPQRRDVRSRTGDVGQRHHDRGGRGPARTGVTT